MKILVSFFGEFVDGDRILTLSDDGRQFLEEHKLLRAQGTLRNIYDRVEKTDEIKRYEPALRPKH